MRKLTFLLLILMIFSLPWDNAVTIPVIGAFGRFIGLLTAGVGIITLMIDGRFRKFSNFHVLLMLFILWGFISYFWSIAPYSSVSRLFTNLQLLAFVWLIWEFTKTKFQLNMLLQSYVLGAYIPVFILIYNFLMNNSAFIGRFSIEGFNPNFLGLILIIGIIYSTYLRRNSQNKFLLLINSLYIPLSMFGILLTGSRTSLIISFFALIYFLWPYFIRRGIKNKVFILVLSGLSIYMVFTYVPDTTWNRLATSVTELNSGNFGDRSIIWKAGLGVFHQNLFNGIGVGAYADLMQGEIGKYVTAHNSFISVLLELGIIGLLMFLIVLIYLFLIILKCPPELRNMWIFNLICILIGMNLLSWEYGKILWIMFGFIPVSIKLNQVQNN